MLESLHVCGSIMTTKDYHYFALYCGECDGSFGQWSGFLNHFESKHGHSIVKTECSSDDEQCTEFDVKREIENELNKLEKSAAEDNAKFQNDAAPAAETDASDDEDNNDGVGQDAADDNDTSSSHEENEIRKSSNRKLKTFNYNLHDESARKPSLQFLKIIKKCPVLWDAQHPKHREPHVRTSTLEDIKDYFEKIGYSISDTALRRIIPKMIRDYKEAKQELIVCGKASEKCALILKECSFLDDAGAQKSICSAANTENQAEPNNADAEESMDKSLEFSEQYDSSSSDVEIQAPSAFFNDGREGKRISFSTEGNPLTIEFINLVRDNRTLWDTRQLHYNLERKRILESWIPIFEERHNITFTYKDLSLNLNVLRNYCHKMDNRKYLSATAQFVKEQCSFLPKPKGTVRIKCEHCDRSFLMQHNYQAHLFSAHSIGENPFKCQVCDRSFSSYTPLDTHLKGVHMKQQTVTCEVCKRGFFRTHDLAAHMKVHTGEKEFICEFCGQGFRRRVNLKNHETRIHLRQRNFACELCPKTFYIKAHLRDHMNVHLDIRNHKCPTCGKAFHSSHALMRHKQIHSAIKRYACRLCEARFHQFVGLNSHMKNRHKYVQDKDEEQPVNLLNQVTVTTTEPLNIDIKGEMMQSMESWNM